MTEAYGQRLGEALRVENAPAIVTRALRTADIAVTEIRCDNPLPEMSGSIQQEDAFLVALQLRDFPNREYWEDGRRASVCDLPVGESCLYDLKRDPTALLDKRDAHKKSCREHRCLRLVGNRAGWLRPRTRAVRPVEGHRRCRRLPRRSRQRLGQWSDHPHFRWGSFVEPAATVGILLRTIARTYATIQTNAARRRSAMTKANINRSQTAMSTKS
jgi:hypothetical protein